MRVGVASVFQNLGNTEKDRDVYAAELALADLVEPLGFDSIWTTEHHFTDYEMAPNPVQFLSYMAGRTSRVKLGTCVIVLPWHDPIRVAEDIALLDNLSGGRVILGIGRGLGLVEFEGFRIDMNETRERFRESAEAVLGGLERGYVEYSGTHVRQPRRDIRPGPLRSFKGRTYCSAVSPDSMPIVAELGAGLLVIPQKRWEEVERDFGHYRDAWARFNAASAPPRPVVSTWCLVDEDASRARDLAEQYIGDYHRSVLSHYQTASDQFSGVKGYEYYAKGAQAIQRAMKRDASSVTDGFVNLMAWGTPTQILERVEDLRRRLNMAELVCHFAYGGMPYQEVERSMRLWARDILPVLQSWD